MGPIREAGGGQELRGRTRQIADGSENRTEGPTSVELVGGSERTVEQGCGERGCIVHASRPREQLDQRGFGVVASRPVGRGQGEHALVERRRRDDVDVRGITGSSQQPFDGRSVTGTSADGEVAGDIVGGCVSGGRACPAAVWRSLRIAGSRSK